jgi:hypothetical protein
VSEVNARMAEDLVKVGLDVRTHTLGLQKIVVERTAPRSVSFIAHRDECAGGTHSAVRAYVPNRIRFCTSRPNPAERECAYTLLGFERDAPGGGGTRRPVSDSEARRVVIERKNERTILNPVEPSKVTRRFSTGDNIVCAQGILRCWERDRPDGRPSIFEAFDDGAQGAGNARF